MRNKVRIAAALLTLHAFAAQAHVTLVQQRAPAGSEILASFRVGHGCSGSPTVSLTVEIPPGVSGARPQAKPGWTIELQSGPDKRISDIIWRGGSLDAGQFDDFNLLLRLPATPGPLAFPVTQTCASGTEHWSEIAAPGRKSTHPAPVLTITAGSASGNSMPGMTMP